MSEKDEIISLQLDIIRQMTERNIRRISDDIWGATKGTHAETGTGSETPIPELGGTADEKREGCDAGPQTATGSDAPPEKKEEKPAEPEKLEDLLAELDSYIGLEAVKNEVRSLVNIARVYKLRRDNSLPVDEMSMHMVFSGNPGTGKTMIARFMARVYHSIGLLSKGHLVETDRSGLVAGYVGQTAIKTSDVLKRALDGVLFIDEAYSLVNGAENDFGSEAIDTVLKFMEDNRDDLVVIVAGYTDLMEEFIDSNPGLRSRFNKYLDFADYTGEEMTAIFRLNCSKGQYAPTDGALSEVKEYFTAASEAAGEFGNARGVRNTFERILIAQANRLATLETVDREALTLITEDDVRAALYPNAEGVADGALPEESL